MQTIPYDLIKWTARDREGNTINRVLYPGAYVLGWYGGRQSKHIKSIEYIGYE